MTFLGMDSTGIILAGVAYLLLAVGQIVHVLFLSIRQKGSRVNAEVLYEAALVLHLVLPCLVAFEAHPLALGPLSVSAGELMWLNVLVLAAGIYAFAMRPRVAVAADMLVVACSIPTVTAALANPLVPIALVNLVYFLFRIANSLVYDFAYGRTHITQLSIVESVKNLSEGLLCSDKRGNVLLMNDRMRYYLHQLDLPTDLTDANVLRQALMDRGTTLQETRTEPSSRSVSIALPTGQTCLFAFDETKIRRTTCLRVIAFDITEKAKLAKRLEEANQELDKTGKEIAESIDALRTIAETQAMLRMKSRVHDIIGQRLSMMHRLLEEGDLSDASIDKMRPLLNGILKDLDPFPNLDASEELSLLKSSLTIIGVDLAVEGELPDDNLVAFAIVSTIRESATNAVRHAQALLIEATIETFTVEDEDGPTTFVELDVVNSGTAPTSPFREGSGIAGMRHSVEAAGGTMTISTHPRFKVHARFPLHRRVPEQHAGRNGESQ